ncbi:MAG: response regulator [Hyphomicrobiaceae bacterium]|nr:response regulator [Hyphomicrobiaceae bacterium]
MKDKASISILIADDDADDRMLIEDAFRESRLSNPLSFVENGEELLHFLRAQGKFESRRATDLPRLILLDLNMPKMDGRTALKHLADPDLRRIPVVVLTTSKAEEDILRTYDLGVSSFITKPVTFQGLVDVVRALNNYWIEIVELPVQ